jgi:DNA (cytosine-5)-methyltransferase 1
MDRWVRQPRVLEFFAGIGLARVGLERAGLRVAWANDYEPAKKMFYDARFTSGSHEYALGDVADVRGNSLPQDADVAWSSSPCTDLSLAGARGGLYTGESSAFWHFMRVLSELGPGRPRVAVLENVVGLATSHGGDDLAAAIRAFNALGYSVDVLTIDARRFIPQSRPRLFLVALQGHTGSESSDDEALRPGWLSSVYEDPTLTTHRWNLPHLPEMLTAGFNELAGRTQLNSSDWWEPVRVENFLSSLSSIQMDRLSKLKVRPEVVHRTAYRRTRGGRPTWEIRADDVAGCLRTARGGSSKQAVVRAGAGTVSVRWMAPGEYASLMGDAEYPIDFARPNQVYYGFGDAVAVPVVEWLARNYIMPALRDGTREGPSSLRDSFEQRIPL